MAKRIVRLNENQLQRIVKESVKKVLNENNGRGTLSYLIPCTIDRFNEFYHANKEKCDEYILKVKESNDYKDLETRLSWDFARATRYFDWMPKGDDGFVLGNSAQLTTLFKQALRKSDIEY